MSNRITVKLKHPNPLFEQWLTEWRDKAIENNSKMQHCFGKALLSLKKYPLPLQSGRDCKLLSGFGEKLCKMLDKKLTEYSQSLSNNENAENVSRRSVIHREYIPQWRSGAYAILLTLYEKSLEHQYSGYMHKIDIIKHAQHLSDKSFLKPDPGNFYTAWSSMKTLIEKQLVVKSSSPAKYSLTDEGIVLAHKLYKTKNDKLTSNSPLKCNEPKMKNKSKKNKVLNSPKKSDEDCVNKWSLAAEQNVHSEEHTGTHILSVSDQETLIFPPYTFDIILLIDKQETSGNSKQLDNISLMELTQLNVAYESRHLKVGDYTWISRHKETNQELVLPYIVERKRMDDLGSSIKDGRFHEQKFRLKQCGIQNLIYLIESHGSNTHVGLPIASLYQAIANTYIQDGFNVKFTDDLKGTVNYLGSFTLLLKKIYESKTLVSCPKQNLSNINAEDDLISLLTFPEFNQGASKLRDFKVKELFVRQLLQLKGISVDKALAIVDKYPTPKLLYLAYQGTTESDGENLLSAVQYGKVKKKIGTVISKVIYQLFTNATY